MIIVDHKLKRNQYTAKNSYTHSAHRSRSQIYLEEEEEVAHYKLTVSDFNYDSIYYIHTRKEGARPKLWLLGAYTYNPG